jgi:DNA-directed RNA polymerase subunit K/omega
MKYFEKTEQKAASVENQYLFTVAVSKRVRSLQEGAPVLVEGVDNSIEQASEAALREFAEDRLDYEMETKAKREN